MVQAALCGWVICSGLYLICKAPKRGEKQWFFKCFRPSQEGDAPLKVHVITSTLAFVFSFVQLVGHAIHVLSPDVIMEDRSYANMEYLYAFGGIFVAQLIATAFGISAATNADYQNDKAVMKQEDVKDVTFGLDEEPTAEDAAAATRATTRRISV